MLVLISGKNILLLIEDVVGKVLFFDTINTILITNIDTIITIKNNIIK